jgi:predicted translin family RNA/ssDNA-binding protein
MSENENEVEMFERPEGTEPQRAKPEYTITLTVEGSRLESVRKKAKEAFGEDLRSIEKVSTATSRADRLSEAESSFEEAKGEVESLRDEIQEWRDNLPENLQSGDKASELDECIEALSSLLDEMESCDFGSISFPGMY